VPSINKFTLTNCHNLLVSVPTAAPARLNHLLLLELFEAHLMPTMLVLSGRNCFVTITRYRTSSQLPLVGVQVPIILTLKYWWTYSLTARVVWNSKCFNPSHLDADQRPLLLHPKFRAGPSCSSSFSCVYALIPASQSWFFQLHRWKRFLEHNLWGERAISYRVWAMAKFLFRK